MNEVATLAGMRGALATPQTIAVRQVMADGIIAVAAKAQNWPLLDEAVDIKIEDQRAFLAEWDRLVVEGRPGKTLTRSVRVSTLVEEAKISEKQVSRWRGWLRDAQAYHDRLVNLARRKAGLEPDLARISHSSGEENRYTPSQYIEAARLVMGGIDLDPASHAVAQRVVQAGRWYSEQDDGLKQPWYGRVWMNPPYTYPAIKLFTAKMADEYMTGTISHGIMVTHNLTDTGWFHYVAPLANVLCFTKGRINFWGAASSSQSPLQGQVFYYFGDRSDSFKRVFSPFGFICEASFGL